jgi:hypothetical protein
MTYVVATALDLRQSRRRRRNLDSSPRQWLGELDFPVAALDDWENGARRRNAAFRAQLSRAQSRCPRLAPGFDPRSLHPPLVLASFHLGAGTPLQALYPRLEADVLVMAREQPSSGPGVRFVWGPRDSPDPASGFGEWGRARAMTEGVRALRAGEFLVVAVDFAGTTSVAAHLFGYPVAIRGGAFACSRLAGAPMVPITARWRGPRVEIICGDPIAPAADTEMAEALMRWIEDYLRENPDHISRTIYSLAMGRR